MNRFAFIFLIFCSQIFNSASNTDKIEHLLARITQTEDNCVRMSKSEIQKFVRELRTIKANLIFNLQYHDGINIRELENIYQCSLDAFEEQLEHLKNEFGLYPFLYGRVLNVSHSNRLLFLDNPEERALQIQLVLKTLGREKTNYIFKNVLSSQIEPMSEYNLPALNMAALQVLDARMVLSGETPQTLTKVTVQALRALQVYFENNPVNKAHTGEWLQAVDTLTHFVQTRLQHETKHAAVLAQISITLIKKVLTENEGNFNNILQVTIEEVEKLADLSQKELEESRGSAHIELFMGGLSNLLLVTRNLAQNLDDNEAVTEETIMFVLNAAIHKMKSIFSGTVQVKQALAIEAFNLKRQMQKFGYNFNVSFLQNFRTFEKVQTSEIIAEMASKLSRTIPCINNSEVLSILQKLNVRLQNIFRMSHETNLQVLFLHITSTLPCIEFSEVLDHFGLEDRKEVTNEYIVELIQKIVIDGYTSSENGRTAMAILQNFQSKIQTLCIQKHWSEQEM